MYEGADRVTEWRHTTDTSPFGVAGETIFEPGGTPEENALGGWSKPDTLCHLFL